MSRSRNCRDWVCVIIVLSACAISVQAAAQVADGGAARGDGRARPDTARLLAEPSDHINSVVAGGEKAFISLTPVYWNADGEPYNQAATGPGYTDANISGNTLAVDIGGGGFRAFFHVEAGQWDSTAGSGIAVRSTSLRLDSSTMLGDNASPSNPGCDILQLNLESGYGVSCTNPLGCQAEFNSAGYPACGGAVAGFCNWGWVNNSKDPHADGKQWIHSNTWLTTTADWGLVSPTGPLCFSSADPSEPRPDDQYPAPYYIGTLALWVPECAAGTYTLDSVLAETYLADQNNVRLPELGVPINYRQAVITVPPIPVGSCCHNIGSGSAGCANGLKEDECLTPGNDPAIWVEDGVCDNPPTNDGCCACLGNDDCHEAPDDLCTNDTCTNCACSSADIPEWDPDECCDATTGATCVPTPGNVCQTAACSLPEMRGTCETAPIAEGDPCTAPGDGNPCTFDDQCQSDESCAGTDVNSAMIPCVDDAECQSITGLTAPTCVSDICDCSLIPDPPRTPDPDPFASHVAKNRYISMVIPERVTFTGFEDAEGFAPGPIEGQAGWTLYTASIAEGHIDTINPYAGGQHLRISKDPAVSAGTLIGARSPDEGPLPTQFSTTTVAVAISGSNGANYYVVGQSPSEGYPTWEVKFGYRGPISVVDDIGNGFEPVLTGRTWAIGPYKILEVRHDPSAGTIDYFYDGGQIYSQVTMLGGSRVEQVYLLSDNNHLADEHGDFDDLSIERGSEADQATAIRVRLTSLHHPTEPLPGTPDFTDWEGEYRWVNAYRACVGGVETGFVACSSQAYCDARLTCQGGTEYGTYPCQDQADCDARERDGLCLPRGGTCQATTTCFDYYPDRTVRCAVLGCEPEYRAWGKDLGGEVLHVTGASVVPDSEYHVIQLGPTCQGNEAACGAVSTPALSIVTNQFGDVGPLVVGESFWEGLTVLDIARVVDHLKGRPRPTTWPPAPGTAMNKPRVQLHPNAPNALGRPALVLDLAYCVNAVKGNPYWYSGDFGPCTDPCPGEAACP